VSLSTGSSLTGELGYEAINMDTSFMVVVTAGANPSVSDDAVRGDGDLQLIGGTLFAQNPADQATQANFTGTLDSVNGNAGNLLAYDNTTSELAADNAQAAIDELVSGGTKQVVHAADATVARPPWQMVIWIGTVEPDNMITGDLWINA